MSKYKIKESRSGFSVWILKDFGNGYAWEDSGRRFNEKAEAEKYISIKKERGETK